MPIIRSNPNSRDTEWGKARENAHIDGDASRGLELGNDSFSVITEKPDNTGNDDDEADSGTSSNKHAVYLSPNMSYDEFISRMLGAMGQLPYESSNVHGYNLQDPTTRDIRLVKLWFGEGETPL